MHSNEQNRYIYYAFSIIMRIFVAPSAYAYAKNKAL